MKRPTTVRTKRAARSIGENINTWRKLRHLTMEQLAFKANVSRNTISRLEKGDPSVSFETVLNVANMLEILDQVFDAFDPYKNDYGRMFADNELPKRMRN